MVNANGIGKRMRDVRVQAQLTQEDIAEKVGIKQAQVSAVEVGRRTTTLEVLERWMEACGATVTVERHDARDPRAQVLEQLAGLDRSVVEHIARAAAALAKLDPELRDQEVWMLEARAGLVERPVLRDPPAAYRGRA